MKTPAHPVILLCGGDINVSSLPIATSGSNAMIPINGKPVIGWILDDLVQKEVQRVLLVTQAVNEQLLNFVRWAFRGRLDVEFVLLKEKGNIIHSLRAGIDQLGNTKGVTVLLGDTLIGESFPQEANCVLVSDNFEDPRNWCLVETDKQGIVCQYFDKQKTFHKGLLALTGFYKFSDVSQLTQVCDISLSKGGKELSDVLERYGQNHPIHAIPAKNWYDFGHMSHFLKAKRDLLQSRYFNQLSIDEVVGIVRKTSNRTEKLSDEYNWYLSLPEELKIMTPRILSLQDKGETLTLVQEYYGYPNLAELYLYGNFDFEIWKVTIKNLLFTHFRLKSFKGPLSSDDARQIYLVKTEERMTELLESNSFFRDLMRFDRICLNGVWLYNYPLLRKGINEQCEHLIETLQGSIIHGDFCLSNILYDINNQLVRLIDPRGRFGTKGIYGDPRYDMAKLRHSLSGGYDFISADLFSIEYEGGGQFRSSILGGKLYDEIADFFDTEMVRAGYLLPEIMFIEGLLFLTMIPLHKDKPKRQIMMYLRSIDLLNRLIVSI